MADNDDLLDYEDEEQTETTTAETQEAPKKDVKGTYVSIHSSGFRDFLLKPEILRAIVDCGFEHPSEVQHECIPQAVLGMDILCQAKSGMGKTAVFVLATLQQLEPSDSNVCHVLVMCHTRELAFQISKEYERFSKYMPTVKVGVFFGGLAIQKDEETLKGGTPHIVVGTPGRILALVRNKKLNLKHLKHFVLDECDKMLEQLDMRRDVQEIFRSTPHSKQVMMFSATLSKDIRPVCKKFMQDVNIYVPNNIFNTTTTCATCTTTTTTTASNITCFQCDIDCNCVSNVFANRTLTRYRYNILKNKLLIFAPSIKNIVSRSHKRMCKLNKIPFFKWLNVEVQTLKSSNACNNTKKKPRSKFLKPYTKWLKTLKN